MAENDSSSSDTESIVDLSSNQIGFVCLVTYSQVKKTKFPTQLEFDKALVMSFDHRSATVIQWCCSEENHKVKGTRYHAAVKLDKVQRWSN